MKILPLLFFCCAVVCPCVAATPGYWIEVKDKAKPKPDGQPALVHDLTTGATTPLSSVDDFKRFVASMKKGDQISFPIGCVCAQFIERDSNGKERRSEGGRQVFFLPLGEEKILLSEAIAFCVERGITFRYAVGF